MNVASVLAVLVLVIGVPLNLYVTVKLLRLSRVSPQLRVLRERAIVAVCVLLVVVVFSLVFWSNDSTPPVLPLDVTKIITRGAVLVVSTVPAVYWLRIYR